MGAFVDLTGKRFGRLVVLSRCDNDKHGKPKWLCQCDCGKQSTPTGSRLKIGTSTSCGCKTIEAATKHGMFGTRVYGIWAGMIYRCTKRPTKKHKNYGNRGISVCNEWKSFENFYNDMGNPPDGYSLERINHDGNYEASNCKWASNIEQQGNKRTNTFVEYNGESHTIAEWGRILNIDPKILRSRLFRSKWTTEKAFTSPILNSRGSPIS